MLGFSPTIGVEWPVALREKECTGVHISAKEFGRFFLERNPFAVLIGSDIQISETVAVLKYIRSIRPYVFVGILLPPNRSQDHILALCNGASQVSVTTDQVTNFEELVLDALTDYLSCRKEKGCTRVVSSGSVASKLLIDEIYAYTKSDVDILITGESGTGTDSLARIIHRQSQRAARPCITLECSNLIENLFESELFGHVKGAFSGATEGRTGLFRAAEGGTILLKDVDQLPQAAQAKLLRVLQERMVRPVGSNHSYPIDIRVISTSSRDLIKMIKLGTFREDLFFRLAVYHSKISPINQRRNDIPSLVYFFLKIESKLLHRPKITIVNGALIEMMKADWPGNNREIRSVLKRAILLAKDDIITVDLIIQCINKSRNAEIKSLSSSITEFKKNQLEIILKTNGGRIQSAAHMIGSNPSTVYRSMKSLQ
jgi:two-component system response regulator GlrR